MIYTADIILSKKVEMDTEQKMTNIMGIAQLIGIPQQQVFKSGSSLVESGGAAPIGKQQSPHSW